jgi:hypothetical protein
MHSLVADVNITLSNLAALLGMVLGTAGFVMSLMNYSRDKPKVIVSLRWDMALLDTHETIGLVSVTNVGQRPIFITVVALQCRTISPIHMNC